MGSSIASLPTTREKGATFGAVRFSSIKMPPCHRLSRVVSFLPQIHSPTSAHPQRERVKSVETRGLKVIFAGEEAKRGRELPNLHLHVAMQVSILWRASHGVAGGGLGQTP